MWTLFGPILPYFGKNRVFASKKGTKKYIMRTLSKQPLCYMFSDDPHRLPRKKIFEVGQLHFAHGVPKVPVNYIYISFLPKFTNFKMKLVNFKNFFMKKKFRV